jgi:hypothetical protein
VSKRADTRKTEGLDYGGFSEETLMEVVAEAARMLDREEEAPRSAQT